MNIVVVGSKALQQHIPEFPVGRDYDFIMTYDTFKQFLKHIKTMGSVLAQYPIDDGKKQVVKTDYQIYEIEIAWEGSTAEEFMNITLNDPNSVKSDLSDEGVEFFAFYPSVDALYTMKMSHRYLKNSPFFHKTMRDIKVMREYLGHGDIKEHLTNWYVRRMEETYSYTHPNLDTDKEFFFKNEPFYIYDHDDIHESVKIGVVPAYKRIIADGAQVRCDQQKFNALTHEHRLHCAIEECYTLALERSLIPNNFNTNPRIAYLIALEKVCTSITSGWFREWCWENYDEISNSFNVNFVGKFQKDLNVSGLIRPFDHDRGEKDGVC